MSELHAELLFTGCMILGMGGIDALRKKQPPVTVELVQGYHRGSPRDEEILRLLVQEMLQGGAASELIDDYKPLRKGIDVLRADRVAITKTLAIICARAMYRSVRPELTFPEFEGSRMACTVFFIGKMRDDARQSFMRDARSNINTGRNRGARDDLISEALESTLKRNFSESFFYDHFSLVLRESSKLGLSDRHAYAAFVDTMVGAAWRVGG